MWAHAYGLPLNEARKAFVEFLAATARGAWADNPADFAEDVRQGAAAADWTHWQLDSIEEASELALFEELTETGSCC